MQNALKEDLNKLAQETMGEKGPDLIKMLMDPKA
jgi:hypothetical protein